MKYFIEDTTLTNIADAVREKEESTQPIPVVELADRIRELKGGGAEIGVTLNDDGTQNLFITETGDLPDLAAITADADAEAKDVLYGKTFYSMGMKKVGSQTFAPVLIWENPDPTSAFAEQTVTLPTGYSAYLVEVAKGYSSATTVIRGVVYVPFTSEGAYLAGQFYDSPAAAYSRYVSSVADGSIEFGSGYASATSKNNSYMIPTRIWGVNFTL